MARRRSVLLVAVAVGALLGAFGVVGASAARPATADATAVTQWNLIAVSTITGNFTNAGTFTPSGTVNYTGAAAQTVAGGPYGTLGFSGDTGPR